jgi:hypothetical protein
LIRWASRDKALRQAAAGTPEMELAVRLYARRQAVLQRARLSVLTPLAWVGLVPHAYLGDPVCEALPSSRAGIGPAQGPVLQAIDAPVIEAPAA